MGFLARRQTAGFPMIERVITVGIGRESLYLSHWVRNVKPLIWRHAAATAVQSDAIVFHALLSRKKTWGDGGGGSDRWSLVLTCQGEICRNVTRLHWFSE